MILKRDKHSIKRFTVNVEYPEVKSARNTQDMVASVVRDKLTEIIEKACDKYGTSNLYKINQLTIDLGDISRDVLKHSLPNLFEKEINRIFSGFESGIYSSNEIGNIEIINEEEQLIIIVEYYLKYGTIPWYLTENIGEYRFHDILTYLLKQISDKFVDRFYKLFEYGNSRKRLLKYTDSEEMVNFFRETLPNHSYEIIRKFRTEIKQLISNSYTIEGTARNYLSVYADEFSLLIIGEIQKSKEIISIELLTRRFIDFIRDEKGLDNEKWIPKILNAYASKESQSVAVAEAMINVYTDFLLKEKSDIELNETYTEKALKDALLKRQPFAGKQIIKSVEEIIKEWIKIFSVQDEEKVRKLVRKIALDITPDTIITQENLTTWIYSITDTIKSSLGIDIQSELTKDKEKRITEDKEEIQRRIEELSVKFNILTAREYIELFFKAGITPFKKIYKHPAKKLKDLFQRYLSEDIEARTYLAEQYKKSDEIILWRIKEHFGEEMFSEFVKILKGSKKYSVPSKIDYDYLIFTSFIKTGDFPWTELISKGKDKLISIVQTYLEQDKKEITTEVLLEQRFYTRKETMKKVFETLPVEYGKQLLQIKYELLKKGILKPEDIAIHDKETDIAILGKQVTDQQESTQDDKATESRLKKKTEDQSETEEPEEIEPTGVVDSLAILIIDFSSNKIPPGLTKKHHANLIYDIIVKSVKTTRYETASMLVSIDKKILDSLFQQLESYQKDNIKKIIRDYRLRFLSVADEIREIEQREEELKISLEDAGAADTFYIENAGLVLLGIYTKKLFSRLGLTNKKKFISNEAKEKAIYLLQYLATKDDNPDEHELILNKILVGMPFGMPLKFNTSLTDKEKQICDGLLEAVIENWKVLKNTSTDGLRTSFLIRNGSLKKEENGWRLLVEKKTYDILLSKLPWGYTMIHLPWMKQALNTEWEN